MAKYKNGINGAFSGRVGNVIGATCRGVDYIRSMPVVSGRKYSQAQINQRIKFALVVNWLRPLLSLINIGFQVLTGNKTPMNLAISLHLNEAVMGEGPEYTIDFKKAVFSRGELLVSWITEVVCLSNALLIVKWADAPESVFCNDTDSASFIVYNQAKEEFVTFGNAAKRGDKEVSLQLPGNFKGDLVHCWMSYVNEKGDKVSTSVYLGEKISVCINTNE
nr:DUF6266 family protein [Pedobacter panaciterrae]